LKLGVLPNPRLGKGCRGLKRGKFYKTTTGQHKVLPGNLRFGAGKGESTENMMGVDKH